jgi:hypothetical protein
LRLARQGEAADPALVAGTLGNAFEAGLVLLRSGRRGTRDHSTLGNAFEAGLVLGALTLGLIVGARLVLALLGGLTSQPS